MAGKQNPLKEFGIEIPPEERTPLVEPLLEAIWHLAGEVDRLKGLPETPHRQEQSSSLYQPPKPPDRDRKQKHKRPKRGKRPGSTKHAKTAGLPVDEVIPSNWRTFPRVPAE